METRTRILPKRYIVLTDEQERNYDKGGAYRDELIESLTERLGRISVIADDAFIEVRRRDGRVVERFSGSK